jgi:sRNA-binding protein
LSSSAALVVGSRVTVHSPRGTLSGTVLELRDDQCRLELEDGRRAWMPIAQTELLPDAYPASPDVPVAAPHVSPTALPASTGTEPTPAGGSSRTVYAVVAAFLVLVVVVAVWTFKKAQAEEAARLAEEQRQREAAAEAAAEAEAEAAAEASARAAAGPKTPEELATGRAPNYDEALQDALKKQRASNPAMDRLRNMSDQAREDRRDEVQR